MAVLADKSELAIIRGKAESKKVLGKKVKLGYHSFGVYKNRKVFDSGFSFWKMLRHNIEDFIWHHGGTNRYGDYQLKPIDDPIHADSDSDNILDSDSDDDYDSDSDDDDVDDHFRSIIDDDDDVTLDDDYDGSDNILDSDSDEDD